MYVSDVPLSVISEFLAGCNGRMCEIAGQFFIQVGSLENPVVTFSDDDILMSEDVSVDPFAVDDSVYNGATGTFMDPETAWAQKDASALIVQDYLDEDNGRENLVDCSSNVVFSGTQLQRMEQAAVNESRRTRRHAVCLVPKFSKWRPLQVLRWNSDRFQYAPKDFLAATMEIDDQCRVYIGLTETDQSDHSWVPETDERNIVASVPSVVRPPPQFSTGWSVAPSSFTDDDDNEWHPSIDLHFPAHMSDVAQVRFQVRQNWDDAVVYDGRVDYDPDNEDPLYTLGFAGLRADKTYQVRMRPIPFSVRDTLWSNQDEDGVDGPWLTVTTPDVPEVLNVSTAALSQELRNIVGPLVLDIYDRFASFDEALGDLANVVADGQDYAQKHISGLTVRSNSAAAAVLRVETVILGPDSAFASLVEEVTAIRDSVYADGMLRIESVVDEFSGLSTILFKVKATNGNFTAEAALQLGASVTMSGEDSYILMMADRFSFIATDDAYISSPFEVNASFVQITQLRIKDLKSVDGTTIDIDGETGFVGITVP